MAHIDALVDMVADPALRAALREQVDSLLHKRSFGLVFQEHRPETVELPQHRVRRGCKVRVRDEPDQVLYRVDKLSGGGASITSLTEPPAQRRLPASYLVVVREFGDPVYPGLARTGHVHRGDDKAAHVVINAENFHALDTLLYTHEGKLDAIYIDPPYNTRDKDWKYNNDYVDSDDVYRHSKWLAMMQRRLRLAGRLLNQDNSVLVVTIDEKEYLRLGLLLEQTFPQGRIQMVSSVINRKGSPRRLGFSRVDEYLFFVFFGDAGPGLNDHDMLSEPNPQPADAEPVTWVGLRRRGSEWRRSDRPSSFFPIYVSAETAQIRTVGAPIPLDADRKTVPDVKGCLTLWPLNARGDESRWQLSAESITELLALGYLRTSWQRNGKGVTLEYLSEGQRRLIETGGIVLRGKDPNGAVQAYHPGARQQQAKTMWNLDAHGATAYGTQLLTALLPGREFDYPKSLYAVEDTLRLFLFDKPDALVLDFFAGSGTTLHAVARLNKQDGGRRRCICVTNNEVSEQEALALTAQGHRPGEDAWEALGICEYVTKPRVRAALTGQTHLGKPVVGTYKFTDPFPMSQGLEENAEFFSLTYEDPDLISLGKKFEAIAPLLWLKAGGRGAVLETEVKPWALAPDAQYALLFDTDQWREFVHEVDKRDDLTHIFVVTDSEAAFQQMVSEFPRGLGCTQLYEDYLHNFQINTRGRK